MKDRDGGGCPSLSRVVVGPEGYIVVGKKVSDDTLAQIPQVADDEVAVFVPANVLDRLRGGYVTRILTEAEFLGTVHACEHTAFRLELQDAYAEPSEDALFAAFLDGDPPSPATEPQLREWYKRAAEHVRQGKRFERVRVQQDPPTGYQRFERWLDRWNIQAGEIMRYMTVQRAYEIGLLPTAGSTDWWLLDSSQLILMRFDYAGHRIENELTTDPGAVLQACRWRDLAVHHSVQAQLPGVSA